MTMKNRYVPFITLTFFLVTTLFLQAQHPFYDVNKIQKIEIYFTQPDWDAQMDTAKNGNDSYIMAKWVKINNTQFDSVGVQYKGSISYDKNNKKKSLHIALDEFDKKKNYKEITDIKLNNGFADPSMLRDVLSYNILAHYMHVPECNFAQVYINGEYYGVFSNVETINKTFCSNHFYSSKNNVFVNGDFSRKALPVPGKCNLAYLGADSSSYYQTYEMKSRYGWKDFINLCDTVSNYKHAISSILDMDRVIWMLAYNNVTVNLDSYSGLFCHNYYVFKDNTKHYNPIVWDLNMGLGGFPQAGNDSGALSALSVDGMRKLPLNLHEKDANWPLIGYVFSVPLYKRMYMAHSKTILNQVFSNGYYTTLAGKLQTIIDTAVKSDTRKFYTYDQFKKGMTDDALVFNMTGFYTVPGISNLMNSRVTYLQSTPEFKAIEPTITAVKPTSTTPVINSTVIVTAQVINTNNTAVLLGYRYNNSEKFKRIPMFDDGTHKDGAAGDNIYGAAFEMKSAAVQYYIYAENNDIGKFSPERAEHEFYTLQSLATPVPGDLIINEFLSNNKNGQLNEQNKTEDWIELYNISSKTISLAGLYLTDNFANKAKFAFPSDCTMAPKSFLMIWADEGISTASYLHANFKLAATGEQLMLSDGAAIIYDSVSFGLMADDLSMGRCPDGTGKISLLDKNSFNSYNCAVGIDDMSQENMKLVVYPNPAVTSLTVQMMQEALHSMKTMIIYTVSGEIIKTFNTTNESEIIDVTTMESGMYFIQVNNQRSIPFTIIRDK